MTQEEEMNMDHHMNGHAMNGHAMNGHAKGPARKEGDDEEKTAENIFLFAPNLIGMRSVILCGQSMC